MFTRCPVCHRPILALLVLLKPLWAQWDCPDCGSRLGVDRQRRILAIIPWFVVMIVLLVFVKIMRYGMLVGIPVLLFTMLIMLMPFSRPVVLARGGFRCRECGYDLEGQTEPKCPECGTAVAGDDLERFDRLRHGDVALALARRDERPPYRRREQILIAAVILLLASALAAGLVVYRARTGPAVTPPAPPPAQAPAGSP